MAPEPTWTSPVPDADRLELERICGSEARPFRGGWACRDTSKANLEELQHRLLDRGLFAFSPRYRSAEIAVLPTTDKYEVVAAMHTSGGNYDLGSGNIIEWLKALEREHPFVLTTISESTLAGRFLQPVGDAAPELARRLYEFCPDIVDQGAGSVEVLEEQLKAKPHLFLWWD